VVNSAVHERPATPPPAAAAPRYHTHGPTHPAPASSHHGAGTRAKVVAGWPGTWWTDGPARSTCIAPCRFACASRTDRSGRCLSDVSWPRRWWIGTEADPSAVADVVGFSTSHLQLGLASSTARHRARVPSRELRRKPASVGRRDEEMPTISSPLHLRRALC
jgi:hypothetical protein